MERTLTQPAGRAVADEHIDALHSNIWPPRSEEGRQGAIAAADVKHRGPLGHHPADVEATGC
jgi:hypothetical protein